MDIIELAKAILGDDSVRAIHAGSLPGDGAIAKVGGAWRIYVRSRLPDDRLRFVVGHELAHLAMGREASEDECDAVAAALLVPADALREAVASVGPDYFALAQRMGTTQSCVALRLAEVTGTPTALVTPQRVRVRGRDWSWPPERIIRRVAIADPLPVPFLQRARLRGEPARVVLTAVD